MFSATVNKSWEEFTLESSLNQKKIILMVNIEEKIFYAKKKQKPQLLTIRSIIKIRFSFRRND